MLLQSNASISSPMACGHSGVFMVLLIVQGFGRIGAMMAFKLVDQMS